METKDSKKSSFARVRVQDSQSSVSPLLSSRSQYLKLLYPNGVALIRKESLSASETVSYRKNYAAPAWKVLQLWCMKHILEVSADTLIYKAISYLLRHYDELTGYLEIARMPIDNNDTERSIRDMVMGKKAYLFCQNDLSCFHAAEMYSFFMRGML